MRIPIGWVCVWLATSMALHGASRDDGTTPDFATDIRPIFEQHCVACHGAETAEGGLRFDSRAVVRRGGDSGQATITPGAHATSRLWQAVSGSDPELQMPPAGEGTPLSADQVATLARWIDAGADWPDAWVGYDPAQAAEQHWAFRPPVRTPLPALPALTSAPEPVNTIDRFVQHRLLAAGLAPAPLASPQVFLRRLYFDLLGIIPEPEEVHAFLNDHAPAARQRWIERTLADPRYGQRWGQHWLDVVRYADTDGFEVNTPRPNAWPYRDYVIQAFNRDVSYQQFVMEQLLGDQLGVDPATGFLVCAAALLPGQIGADELSKQIARQDELDEIVAGTCSTLLGLTVGCARCHHHKFDPITQQDYYSLQAVFSGVRFGERAWLSDAYRRDGLPLEQEQVALEGQLLQSGFLPAVSSRENREQFLPRPARWVRFTILTTNSLEPCLDELQIFRAQANVTQAHITVGTATSNVPPPERINVALAEQGAMATSSGNLESPQHRLAHIHDGQFGNARSWMGSEMGKGWVQIELPQIETIDEVVWQRDRTGQYTDRTPIEYKIEIATQPDQWTTVASSELRLNGAPQPRPGAWPLLAARSRWAPDQQAALQSLLARHTEVTTKLQQLRAALPGQVFAGKFTDPQPIHVLMRGDVQQPQQPVSPDALAILGHLQFSQPDPSDPERRRSFASWVTSRDNPLTARVLVNRIWHYHFGTGIVETPSDFGTKGSAPSHPELLDWLTLEFIDHGWSIKHLHRLILESHTYAQSSTPHALGMARDADNRLLWRYASHRMEAEVLRDTLLTVSGELNGQMGGPGFDLFESRGGLNGFPPIETFDRSGLRRMIYAHKVRMERDAVFGAFDCPDAGQTCPKRSRSTTALQALNLFNSPFVLARATQFARRIQHSVEQSVKQSQTPNHHPATTCSEDLQAIELQIEMAYQIALNRSPDPEEWPLLRDFVGEYGLVALARALFNTNEFVVIP